MRYHRIQIYSDRQGMFRWRLRARNGKIVAESGEGYARMIGAIGALRAVVKAFREDTVDLSALEGKRRPEDTFAVNR